MQHDDKWHCALKLGGFYPPYIKEFHQYWRFITSHFIHAEFFHFLMNAYALYQIGHFLEACLGTLPYLYIILIFYTSFFFLEWRLMITKKTIN